MNNKDFQLKLDQRFKEYVESRRDDENSLEEYYNTPRGYAVKEYASFLRFHGFEIPEWVNEFYENP